MTRALHTPTKQISSIQRGCLRFRLISRDHCYIAQAKDQDGSWLDLQPLSYSANPCDPLYIEPIDARAVFSTVIDGFLTEFRAKLETRYAA